MILIIATTFRARKKIYKTRRSLKTINLYNIMFLRTLSITDRLVRFQKTGKNNCTKDREIRGRNSFSVSLRVLRTKDSNLQPMKQQFSPLSEHASIERGAHRKTIKPPILSTHLVLQKGQIRAKTNKEVQLSAANQSMKKNNLNNLNTYAFATTCPILFLDFW